MLNLLISILLSLGLIVSQEQFESKPTQEKKELQEKYGIIEDDVFT